MSACQDGRAGKGRESPRTGSGSHGVTSRPASGREPPPAALLPRPVLAGIPELRRIVSFRNILIHGYAEIDDRVVWEALTTRVSPLKPAVVALLGQFGSKGPRPPGGSG